MIPADVGDRPRGGATEPKALYGIDNVATTGPDHLTPDPFPLPPAEPELQDESTASYISPAFC